MRPGRATSRPVLFGGVDAIDRFARPPRGLHRPHAFADAGDARGVNAANPVNVAFGARVAARPHSSEWLLSMCRPPASRAPMRSRRSKVERPLLTRCSRLKSPRGLALRTRPGSAIWLLWAGLSHNSAIKESFSNTVPQQFPQPYYSQFVLIKILPTRIFVLVSRFYFINIRSIIRWAGCKIKDRPHLRFKITVSQRSSLPPQNLDPNRGAFCSRPHQEPDMGSRPSTTDPVPAA